MTSETVFVLVYYVVDTFLGFLDVVFVVVANDKGIYNRFAQDTDHDSHLSIISLPCNIFFISMDLILPYTSLIQRGYVYSGVRTFNLLIPKLFFKIIFNKQSKSP